MYVAQNILPVKRNVAVIVGPMEKSKHMTTELKVGTVDSDEVRLKLLIRIYFNL